MKTYLKILTLLFIAASLCSNSKETIQNYTLEKAISSNAVFAHFDCNTNSVHYEKPLLAKIKNRTNVPIQIEIPAGTWFQAKNNKEQNIVTTRPRLIKLLSGAATSIALQGNCMEANDIAGSEGSQYVYKGRVSLVLQRLIDYLTKNKITANLGQQAVWCITDNKGLENIYDSDNAAAEKLRSKVSTLLNKPLPNPKIFNGYAYNYNAKPKVEVKGKFNMSFGRNCNMAIAMFDENGTVVRELFRNQNLPAGKHSLTYSFDNSVYTNDKYIIRAIKNGNIIFTRVIDLT